MAAAGGRDFSTFEEISPESREVLRAQGFERATPVQEATIPLFAGNKDVAVDACTGSGKTLAFLVPTVDRLRRLEQPLKKHQVPGPPLAAARRRRQRQHCARCRPRPPHDAPPLPPASQVGAIIVSPTRELARQIHGVALPFVGTVPGLRALLLVGGT